MAISFTDAQQKAIDACDESLLVSAAAGSGKTAVLTARVMRLLTGENPVMADKLVIVTFTVAAAEEMRHRISSALSDMLLKNPENELIETQQILLQNAKICTIDSLCKTIVSENFHTLGLTANASLEDGAKINIIKNESINEILEEFYTENSPEYRDLFDSICNKNDTPLINMIISIYDYIRAFAFPMEYLEKAENMYSENTTLADNPWIKSIDESIDISFDYIFNCINSCRCLCLEEDSVAGRYIPFIEKEKLEFTNVYKQYKALGIEKAYKAACSIEKERISAPSRKPEISELCKEITKIRKQYFDEFAKVRDNILSYTDNYYASDMDILKSRIAVLFSIVRRVYTRIDEKKQAEEIMDFNDIEHFALKLLVTHENGQYVKTPLGKELSEDIAEIMVDECQDINDLQNELFNALSRNGNNLFMVGDVKQSIYRFRRASPFIFTQKKKQFYEYGTSDKKTGAFITLDANFRSRKEVCNAVNLVFSKIMTETVGELEYKGKEMLAAAAEYPESNTSNAEFHIISPWTDSNENECRQCEANYLAGIINNYIKSGYPVFEKGNMRKCRYDDFCILFRGKGNIGDVYVPIFKQYGIPCMTNTGENFFETYEVQSILNFLKVIDNPLLDIPLLSAMLSPILGFSADDVAKVRIESKGTGLYKALLSYAKSDTQAENAVKLISGLREYSAQNTIADLIRRIYDETEYIAFCNALSDGEQKAANLRILLNKAESYEANSQYGLSGFLRYMDKAQSESELKTQAFSSGTNAVRLMTIHASKGLEFPICILADFDHTFNNDDLRSKYLVNDSYGFGMKVSKKKELKEYSNFAYEAIKFKNMQESISEEMRILYVAMTRAKEKLIMTACPKCGVDKYIKKCSIMGSTKLLYNTLNAKSYGEWVMMSIFEDKDNIINIIKADAPEKISGQTVSQPVENIDMELLKRLKKSVCYKYPFEEQTLIPAKLTVTQIAKAQQGAAATLKTKPAFLQQGGFTPAQKGSILHKFMQFADFKSAKADVNAEINNMIEKNVFTEQEADVLDRGKITEFLYSKLFLRMENADRLLREYKFNCFITPADANISVSDASKDVKILIQGIADCVIAEADGLVIVDYKTDYVKNENVLKDRYYDQLRIYKEAVEAAFGEKVKECLIYSLSLSKEIKIDI